MERKLYRSDTQKIVAGVCGGLGEYFAIDPVIVRLIFVLVVLAGGAGALIYIISWIIIPRRPYLPVEAGQSAGNTGGQPGGSGQTPSYSATPERSMSHYLPGLILILIGAALLIRQTFYWFSWKLTLPIVLVGIGAVLIYRSLQSNKTNNDGYQTSNF